MSVVVVMLVIWKVKLKVTFLFITVNKVLITDCLQLLPNLTKSHIRSPTSQIPLPVADPGFFRKGSPTYFLANFFR